MICMVGSGNCIERQMACGCRGDIVILWRYRPTLDNTKSQEKQTNTSQEVIRAEDRLDVGGNLGQYGQRFMLCCGQIRWE